MIGISRATGGTPEEEARELHRIQDGQSILDDVRSQVKTINGKLRDVDRQRLDLYLTSVREAEQRLQQHALWSKTPKPQVKVAPPTNEYGGAQLVQRCRQWFDIVQLALQTDCSPGALTRRIRDAQGTSAISRRRSFR